MTCGYRCNQLPVLALIVVAGLSTATRAAPQIWYRT